MIYLRLIAESIRFAWQALRANMLRTLLSLLGVTIGIFAIISVFTLVDSLERNVRDSMSFIGDKVLYVQKWPWSFGGSYPWWKYFQRPEATMREFKLLDRNLINDAGVAIFADKGGSTYKYRSNSFSDGRLMGVTYDYSKVSEIPIEEGRYFVPQEVDASRNVIVIGKEIAETLFPYGSAVGQELKVGGQRFRVIGVVEKQGENMFGAPNFDQMGIIPFGSFSKMYDTGPEGVGTTIAVKGRDEDEGLQELEYEVRGMMRNIRGLRPRDDDSFAINRPEMATQAVTGFFDVIGLAGWVIGGFAILVGGFGIANIMFVSVKERTNIIGIQKSLGAKNYFILFQFLFESVFLSLIGGGIGILLVFLITIIPQDMMKISLSVSNIVLGLGVSAVIGMLSGIIPAVLASNLDPVIAIRSK
ncbi:ABC transporter permease [Pontibacter sp. BT310]|jgi:putative ABC transport system permease protein|uniref:ABC transporter permease n=1 Tax=Pontibacter populi TaxID=890055 RepID=A0ABS6X8Y5_9BACT|nr:MULTISPECIES: ABC transporter permease [Pontibacter]MBJ6117463.1 ABC transporter permease [Pontibacter sp. BT310]MBR0569888.1 ABC transporter permease [Microvirga sp. STS03]MBW3364316.1 ABC transporter permease [Pontibacter populi]